MKWKFNFCAIKYYDMEIYQAQYVAKVWQCLVHTWWRGVQIGQSTWLGSWNHPFSRCQPSEITARKWKACYFVGHGCLVSPSICESKGEQLALYYVLYWALGQSIDPFSFTKSRNYLDNLQKINHECIKLRCEPRYSTLMESQNL